MYNVTDKQVDHSSSLFFLFLFFFWNCLSNLTVSKFTSLALAWACHHHRDLWWLLMTLLICGPSASLICTVHFFKWAMFWWAHWMIGSPSEKCGMWNLESWVSSLLFYPISPFLFLSLLNFKGVSYNCSTQNQNCHLGLYFLIFFIFFFSTAFILLWVMLLLHRYWIFFNSYPLNPSELPT